MIPYGIHPNVLPSVYHRRELGIVSKSALDLVTRSPAHYKAWIDGVAPDEETPALTFGRAFHCAVLEPDRFRSDYSAEPDFGDCRSKDNKARRDAWRDEHAAHELISAESMTTIEGMIASIHAHPLASAIIRDGLSELTISWRDSETGLSCKSRADYFVEKRGMVADVKSCLDASYDAFRRDVVKYRYHVQDALYRAGFAEAGAAVQHFIFVAVEKAPPFAVAVYSLESEGIGKGYSAARADIDLLADCVKRNEFPGYPPGIQELTLPPWAA